jgi:hypothetical protein
MSAFIVSEKHIQAIVNYAVFKIKDVYFANGGKLDLRTPEDRNRLGQILWDANVESVNYRYTDNQPYHKFEFRPTSEIMSPVQMIKALRCLNYQSCEIDDWNNRTACRLIESLILGTVRFLPGYEEAEWEIQ